MVDPKFIQEWISKADDDLGYAEHTINDTEYYAHACFNCQQAAEKYLKAFIIAKGLPFAKTHILAALLKTCKEAGYPFDDLLEAINILDGCYIDTRYPVHWPSGYSKNKALQAFEAAKQIRNTILPHLR